MNITIDILSNKKILLILITIFIYSCSYKQDRNKTTISTTITESSNNLTKPGTPKIKYSNPTINIYIENSGSMDGYVRGNTKYKDAVTNLLVDLKHFYGEEKIKIHFICDNIYKSNDSFSVNFAYQLAPNSIDWRQGNRGSTSLNNIVRMVLENTHKDDISILISDCIYSLRGQDTEGLLTQQKSLTKDAFLSKLKEFELICTIIKLHSEFTGSYWDKNDNSETISNKIRPYYIWIIGNQKSMDDFNSKIQFKEFTEYQNSYIITKTDTTVKPYYTVLSCSYNKGRFKPIRDLSCSKYIHGIEGIDFSERDNNTFRFAVAVDLSKIPVENDYLTNKSNYNITGNYQIESIEKINKKNLCPFDKNMVGSATATYVITFSVKSKAIDDLTFELKKQIPKWVFDSDTIDDTNINQCLDKTFGFKYLIEGVEQAYSTISEGENTFLKISIPIKKTTESSFGKGFLIFLIIVILGGIIFFVIRKLKNN